MKQMILEGIDKTLLPSQDVLEVMNDEVEDGVLYIGLTSYFCNRDLLFDVLDYAVEKGIKIEFLPH